MSDTPSITEAAHQRGSDGQLLPVDETVEIHDAEYEVQVIPATHGQRNEWMQRLDNEGADLSDDVTADLLDEFAAHEPADFGAESWGDVRPAITDALGNVILARLFDAGDVDEFQQALSDVSESQGNQT